MNLIGTREREHSRKPNVCYDVIEACSPGSRPELLAREPRTEWTAWGNQAEAYEIGLKTYAYGSRAGMEEWAQAAE